MLKYFTIKKIKLGRKLISKLTSAVTKGFSYLQISFGIEFLPKLSLFELVRKY